MSRTSIPSRPWLIWKESMQLMPLVLSLFAIVSVLAAIQYSLWGSRPPSFYSQLEWTFLILPVVFAVGAAAISVGFEREQRTLETLSLLPISRTKLVGTKVFVSLVGLLLMWLIAIVCMHIGGVERTMASRLAMGAYEVNQEGIHLLVWGMRSLFILAVGFYTSWQFRNPFLALVVLIVMVSLPSLLLNGLLSGLRLDSEFAVLAGSGVYVSLNLLLAFVATLFGYHAAMRGLGPATATPRDWPKTIQVAIAGGRIPTFRSRFSAMVWMSTRSSTVVWGVLAVMLGGSLLVWRYHQFWRSPSANDYRVFSTLVYMLAVSWCGVAAFKFSGAASELRRLAEMGASPTEVYFARHLVPLGMIATTIILYTWAATDIWESRSWSQRTGVSTMASMLTATIASALIYGISQWISQMMKITVLTALAAPLVAIPVTLTMLNTRPSAPVSVLTCNICVVATMLVTWWRMGHYMNGSRRGIPLSLGVAIVLIVFGLRPSSLSYAQLKAGRLHEMADKAVSVARRKPSPEPIWLRSKVDDASIFDGIDDPALLAEARRVIERPILTPGDITTGIDRIGDSSDQAISFDSEAWALYYDALTYQRVRFRGLLGNEDGDKGEETSSQQQFALWLETTGAIVRGLRNSPRWIDQEFADRFEIWLSDTLSDSQVASKLDEEVIRRTLTMLPSSTARNRQRWRAVLLSFAAWQGRNWRNREYGSSGGLAIDTERKSAAAISSSNRTERFYEVTCAAIKAIEHSEALASERSLPLEWTTWQRTMHDYTVPALVPFESGPYGDQYRSLPAMMTLDYPNIQATTPLFPARFIAMPWEQSIERLKKTYSTNTEPSS